MMSNDEFEFEPKSEAQRRVLFLALLLNASLTAGLGITGWIADSSALVANALDNASDAAVYAISFFAVARGARWKARAAQLSGLMLLEFAAGVLADVVRRFIVGAEPVGPIMMVMAVIAAIVNILCLKLLRSHREDDVNLRAAWTFSINDLLSNLGVLAAGVLVIWLGRSWPDWVIGLAIALCSTRSNVKATMNHVKSTSLPIRCKCIGQHWRPRCV
jgi:cobalt-zinc-cadmium efflux system protein